MFKSKYEKLSEEEKQIRKDGLDKLTKEFPSTAKVPEGAGELVRAEIEDLEDDSVEIEYVFSKGTSVNVIYRWDGAVWNFYDSIEEDDSFSFGDIEEDEEN